MVGRHVKDIIDPELLAATEQIVSDSLVGEDGRVEVQSSLTGRTIVIQSAPVRTPTARSRGSSSSRATSPSSAWPSAPAARPSGASRSPSTAPRSAWR